MWYTAQNHNNHINADNDVDADADADADGDHVNGTNVFGNTITLIENNTIYENNSTTAVLTHSNS